MRFFLVYSDKLLAWALALCAGLVLALIVAMTTKSEKRPRGHSVRTFKCCSGRYFLEKSANRNVSKLGCGCHILPREGFFVERVWCISRLVRISC